MKIICLPFHSPDFYLKPDTALLRKNQAFYRPDACSRLSGAMALVVKINRLGRHIAPRFANRYYDETSIGFCLYADDVLENLQQQGRPWGPAVALDYSAPLAEPFIPLSQSQPLDSIFSWAAPPLAWEGRLEATLGSSPIDEAISRVSQYIFLKMGDLLWIELHTPQILQTGQEVLAHYGTQTQLRVPIK